MSKVTSAGQKSRGEANELKEDLLSSNREVQRNAIRKIIASMTIGRDMSSLFSDVVRLINSASIDIKKLVYLYVIANAKMQQDKAVLLAGSFIKDCQHESPLIRGLAIRTMSAIPVEKMADHLASPLREAMRDQDPYVRKCAAMAVAKMFANNRTRTEDGGFIQQLHELLSDANPNVVSSAVCSITEIRVTSDLDSDQLEFSPNASSTLLNAISDVRGCNEWGQVYILDGLASFDPGNHDKAELICERLLSRLQHSNAAVVLSSIRIIMNFIEKWCKGGSIHEDVVRNYCQKIAPPLVSLVTGGAEFEIRYIALRNITIILQRFPDLLTSQIKMFFVKYNDPIYIKLEKLAILLILVNHLNVRQILSEFSEYAQEVDVEFVRKAVRAIGITAIKIESAAEECIGVLTDLVKTRVNYVVQESIIVTRDIFRKYPGRYESMIGLLCDNLDTLDEPQAKAAMIWIIGEYAEKIENADELLDDFAQSFEDEMVEVQLAILTAVVKLFLKRGSQDLLTQVLQQASASEVPDLRERAYMYWRLLSAEGGTAAQTVVLSHKDTINEEQGTRMDLNLTSELIQQIGTLASVFHKPPDTFVQNYHGKRHPPPEEEEYDEDEVIEQEHPDGNTNLPKFQHKHYEDELAEYNAQLQKNPNADLDDWFDAPSAKPQQQPEEQRELWCSAEQTHGIQVSGRFLRIDDQLFADVSLTNNAPQVASNFQLQFNNNLYGITLSHLNIRDLAPHASHEQLVQLGLQGRVEQPPQTDLDTIQVALKTNLGLGFGLARFPTAKYLSQNGALSKEDFLKQWRAVQDTSEQQNTVGISPQAAPRIQDRLTANGFFFVAKRSAQDQGGVQDNTYYSAKFLSGEAVMVELAFMQSSPSQCTVSVCTVAAKKAPLILKLLTQLLSQQ